MPDSPPTVEPCITAARYLDNAPMAASWRATSSCERHTAFSSAPLPLRSNDSLPWSTAT